MPPKKATNFIGVGRTLDGKVIPAKRPAETAAARTQSKQAKTKADDDDEDFVLNSDEEEDSEDEDGDMVEVPMDLAIDEYELQDDDGNITICKLAPEEIVDNLFDPKRIADIQALPGFEENTIRGRVRQIAVIKRAKADMILPEGRLIPVAPGERDVPDTRVDIIVCANGDWTPLPKPEADGKQKSRRSLRMMTAEEKAKWGTNNECDCKICIKEKQFVANVAEAGRTRSWKVFKKPEGYVLGGGEV